MTLPAYPILKKIAVFTTFLLKLCPHSESLPSIRTPTALLGGGQEQQSYFANPPALMSQSVFRGGSTTAVVPEGMNPFVLSSPIVAAVVCQDGIVLLAIHSNIPSDDDNSDDENSNNSNNAGANENSQPSVLHDLPADFSGPFRIQSLDLQGTTLLTAGWRADAQYFVTKAQDIYKDEKETVGTPSPYLLASQLSVLLATTAVSGGDTRELNCVALLATPEGSLWLIDQTGVYAVRALALGGGSFEVNAHLNDKLRQTDWQELGAKEGLAQMLDMVKEGVKETALQHSLAVETAIVDFQGRLLVRKFIKDQNSE